MSLIWRGFVRGLVFLGDMVREEVWGVGIYGVCIFRWVIIVGFAVRIVIVRSSGSSIFSSRSIRRRFLYLIATLAVGFIVFLWASFGFVIGVGLWGGFGGIWRVVGWTCGVGLRRWRSCLVLVFFGLEMACRVWCV